MTSNGARDFEFLYGSWTFQLRRLRVSTDPDCTEWLEGEGTSEAFPILGGLGNIDRLWMAAADGADPFEGCTLRLYDPASDTWRIWWVSTRTPGVLDEPVVGRFDGGRGTFECDDVVNGVAVRVRYSWYVDPDEPRFEQSFSRAGGDTWWTNWVTTQRRR